MRNPIVVVAEDDPVVVDSIRVQLGTDEKFHVDVASSGYDALRIVGERNPDALLLDTTLPDLPGTQVCRVIRARERTADLPIIMLGGRLAGDSRPVDGFDAGADDYVVKPFDPFELEARLRAVLRRRAPRAPAQEDVYVGRLLSANFTDVSISVGDQPVALTKREFLLLRFLVHHSNQVVDRDSLLAHVWGSKHWDDRIVDSAIYKLRTKLREAGSQIQTVPGFGYRFNDPVADQSDSRQRSARS